MGKRARPDLLDQAVTVYLNEIRLPDLIHHDVVREQYLGIRRHLSRIQREDRQRRNAAARAAQLEYIRRHGG